MIQCVHCNRAFSTDIEVSKRDVKTRRDDRDHLYVMTSAALPGLCKIGRSHDPELRASELQASMPFFIDIYAIFWKLGPQEHAAHCALSLFRKEGCPGREWYQIEAKDAVCAIARALDAADSMPAPDDDEC